MQISDTKIDLVDLAEDETNFEEEKTISSELIWKRLDGNFAKTLPFVEETVDRWNSRVQLAKGGPTSAQAKK